jgi:hypothetical protein
LGLRQKPISERRNDAADFVKSRFVFKAGLRRKEIVTLESISPTHRDGRRNPIRNDNLRASALR